jgi:hypothetical protein
MFSKRDARPPGRATLCLFFTIAFLPGYRCRTGRESGLAATLIVTFRYAANLVAAILSALLAPICVSSFSAFISSCRLSFSRAAAFGMLS